MTSLKTLTVVTLLLGVLGAVPAFGAVVIDFGTGTAGTGGLYTLLAGGQATGSNIPVGSVTITGAVSNNGVFDTSGTCASTDANGSACLSFDTVANTISIVGGIGGLGIANGTTLLTGSFTSFSATGDGISNARGPDTKSPLLLAALGVTGYQFDFFGFSITANTVNVGASSTVISTDIRNTGNPVPEPSAIVLFGTALLGCCSMFRRKRSA